MRVRDIMTTPVVTLRPDTPLADVARLLVANEISGTPVVDDAGALVGMVTEADLILALEVEPSGRIRPVTDAEPRKVPRTAADVMSTEVVVVEEDAPISEVASIMVHRRIKRVPVVRGTAVVGIVSRRDVIGTLTRSDEEITTDVQELLDDVIEVIGRFRASTLYGCVTLTGVDDPDLRRAAERTARSVPGVVDVGFVAADRASA